MQTPTGIAQSEPILQVTDLSIRFGKGGRALTAVDRLSFSVKAGETLAIVGESGCGKSVTALSLTRLLGDNATTAGSIRFEGRELTTLDARGIRAVRGKGIATIFQDPMQALNPVMTIGDQLVEAILAHEKLNHRAARERAQQLLEQVRIPEAARRLDDYPHRFSGGMRQRAAIAIALAGRPRLLIADEPTTALDVTIQAQILSLLSTLQRELGMALILITHDLGVVAETADRVLVMYAGRKVEEQNVQGLFRQPHHPYTRGLMAARPHLVLDDVPHAVQQRLHEIPGIVPMLSQLPVGCAFAPRCPNADAQCDRVPALRATFGEALVACHHPASASATVPLQRVDIVRAPAWPAEKVA